MPNVKPVPYSALFLAWAQRRILLTACKVALAVGTVLNLINQGDALWGQQSFSAGQLLLNYVVPFLVSSYSAARYAAQAGTTTG